MGTGAPVMTEIIEKNNRENRVILALELDGDSQTTTLRRCQAFYVFLVRCFNLDALMATPVPDLGLWSNRGRIEGNNQIRYVFLFVVLGHVAR